MDTSNNGEANELLYSPNSIEQGHADNDLKTYESMLGFDRKSLTGKQILDLGAGETDRLARDLKAAEIDANVIGLSPDFTTSSIMRPHRLLPEWKRNAVQGIAQRLPFKNESFDIILGLYSVTYYSWYPEQVKAWTSEIRRVLRDGGEARLGPVYRDDEAERAFGKDYQYIKGIAKANNMKIEVNEWYILMRKSSQEVQK